MEGLDDVSDGGDAKSNGKDDVPFETGVEAVVGVAGSGRDVAVGGGNGGCAGGRWGGCWRGRGVHCKFERDDQASMVVFCSELMWLELSTYIQVGSCPCVEHSVGSPRQPFFQRRQ